MDHGGPAGAPSRRRRISRDHRSRRASLARSGRLGSTLTGPATGYSAVYLIELFLLFATLIAIGPLAGRRAADQGSTSAGMTAVAGSIT